MNIFRDMENIGLPKEKSKEGYTSDAAEIKETTEYKPQQRSKQQTANSASKKKNIWEEVITQTKYGISCLLQVLIVIILIIAVILILGFLTKGCSKHYDEDHVHFERYHQ